MSENKYKWLEFDEKSIVQCGKVAALDSCDAGMSEETAMAHGYLYGARFQYRKNKAIMLKLLEIIEAQSNKIYEVGNYLQWREDDLIGDDLKGDGLLTKKFKSQLKTLNETLTKTERMLKELEGE